MIHEVMVLDHSGPAFGMILFGAALKTVSDVAALIVRLVLPFVSHRHTGTRIWAVFLAGVQVVSRSAVGVVESVMARLHWWIFQRCWWQPVCCLRSASF